MRTDEIKSLLGDRLTAAAIANGLLMESGEKPSQKRSQKRSQIDPKTSNPAFPTPVVENVYQALKLHRKAKYAWLADNLGISEATVKRAIADLKNLGYINSEHSKIKDEWQLLK